jgi:pimeloyl-ACP methyl ester carboxylesterase
LPTGWSFGEGQDHASPTVNLSARLTPSDLGEIDAKRNARFNASQRDRIDLPLVLAGGDHGFGPLLPGIAETLRAYGWQHVTTVLIENSGHYVADEQPEAVAELIERHAS